MPNATFSGLACGRSYDLAVDAYDANGNRSTRQLGHLVHRSVPRYGASVGAVGIDPDGSHPIHGRPDWTASSDNVGVAGYGIYLAGVRIASTSSPGYTFASLTCGTTYSAGVDAYDAAGSRSAVATLFVATAACLAATRQAPSAPQNQSIAAVTESSFRMSWSAATDNVGVTGYAVYLNGARSERRPATSYTYTGLTCGTAYTVGLEAFDAAGNTSDLTQATGPAATSACTPAAGHAGAFGTGQPHARRRVPDLRLGVLVGVVRQRRRHRLWLLPGRLARRQRHGDELRLHGARVWHGLLARDRRVRRGRQPLRQGHDHRDDECLLAAAASASSGRRLPVPGGANLWVDTSGGSCARQAAPGAYADWQACSWNQAYQAAQTGDLILVRGGNYGDVKIGPNKTSIGSPGVTFRTASGENVVVDDFENGHIAGAHGRQQRLLRRPRQRPHLPLRPGQQRRRRRLERRLRRLQQRSDLPPRERQQRHRPQLGDPGQHQRQPDVDQRLEPDVREQPDPRRRASPPARARTPSASTRGTSPT